MKALLYLTYRQAVNGVQRALREPRRLLGLLFFVVTMGLGPLRFLWAGEAPRPGRKSEAAFQNFQLPPELANIPLEVVNAAVFVLMFAFFLMQLSSVLGYRGSFKPADVDVLFTTPVSPKLIMTVRMIRDSLLSTLLPILFYAFAIRPTTTAWGKVTQGLNPEAVNQVVRLGLVGTFLMSFAFVVIGYGTSQYLYRAAKVADTQRRIVTVSILVMWAAIIGLVYWVIYFLTNGGTWKQVLDVVNHPGVRAVLFIPDAVTRFAMSPLEGGVMALLYGFGVMVALSVVGYLFAMRQAEWLYDNNAMRASAYAEAMDMVKRGDTYSIMAHKAREKGKKKHGAKWVHRIRVTGPAAILWKDLILLLRTSLTGIILPAVAFLPAIVLMINPSENSARTRDVIGYVMLGIAHYTAIFMPAAMGKVGLTELLRRVDVLKPMPFASATTIYMEILGKALPMMVAYVAVFLGLIPVAPKLVQYSLGGLVFCVPMVLATTALVAMVLLFFPDVDDPTQNGIRGLVNLLGILAISLPTAGIYALLLFFFKWPGPLAALPSALMALGISWGLAYFSGKRYEHFNPKE